MDKATEIMVCVMEQLKEKFDEAAATEHYTEMLKYSEKLCEASHAVCELRGSDVNSMMDRLFELIKNDKEPT